MIGAHRVRLVFSRVLLDQPFAHRERYSNRNIVNEMSTRGVSVKFPD